MQTEGTVPHGHTPPEDGVQVSIRYLCEPGIACWDWPALLLRLPAVTRLAHVRRSQLPE